MGRTSRRTGLGWLQMAQQCGGIMRLATWGVSSTRSPPMQALFSLPPRFLTKNFHYW